MEIDRGLKILNISKNDDGVYTCRAEVDAEGRYDERKITVLVHGTFSDWLSANLIQRTDLK